MNCAPCAIRHHAPEVMKVLFITHSLARDGADAARSPELRLARALRDENIEVLLLAPGVPGQDAEDFDGIAVERFAMPRRQVAIASADTNHLAPDRASWRSRITTLRFLSAEFTSAVRARRAFEPSIVHAHWWFPGGLVGTWVSALGNVPLVTSLHRADLRSAQAGSFARPLFRHVMKHSAVVTADSHGLARKARSVISSPDPIVAPMPAATEVFVPGGERATDRLLLVASLAPDNGIEQTLEAVATMRHRVSIDIVGSGAAAADYQTLADGMGLRDRVRWHPPLDELELARICQATTAVVVPSLREWVPPIAVQALLCRTPVVAFDFGGVTDIVHHDRTGILVQPSNTMALTRALDALFSRPDLGANLGEAGRIYALATFAPESVARRFAGIYRQALAAAST
jgi:glycosyltransferase involved in cell wall biosynthesis